MKERPTPPKKPVREPSYVDALLPLVTLMVLIVSALYLYGLDALSGPIPVALVVCSMVAGLVILRNGHEWEAVADEAVSVSLSNPATACAPPSIVAAVEKTVLAVLIEIESLPAPPFTPSVGTVRS